MRDEDSRSCLPARVSLAGMDLAPIELARLDRRLPEIYLVLALVLTGLLCFLTAPFFGPDEPDQASRAISLSHGALLAHMGPSLEGGEEAGAEIDEGAVRAMDGIDDIREAWEAESPHFQDRPYGMVREDDQRHLAGIGWMHRRMFLPFGNTAPYPPALYLPAMAGWRAGEAAGLTIFESLRLARLFCALTAVGLGWLALRLCACSRWMLLPFLLLPSTLFLNASCSQDAILLPVAALVVAMLSRPIMARREFTRVELAVTAVLLALCATARPPYVAMALVLFLPAIEMRAELRGKVCDSASRESNWRRWVAPGVAFTIVVAICGIWLHLVAPFGLEHSDESRPELQAIFLRAHPVAAAWAVLKGTVTAAGDFARRGVYVVGWNDLLPHHGAAAALVACLAVVVLLAPACSLRTWWGRGLLALSVAAPLLGISLAEYIIWTPPGWHTVYGVQPRYWLPVMPLATMLLQSVLRLRWAGAVRTWLLAGATAVLAIIACTLPWMVAHAFYRDSVAHVLELNLR
jgi:Predicted membrane protein (DUF2142)